MHIATQSSMIPGGERFKGKLKGSGRANHRLALELAITNRSDIHTKTAKALKSLGLISCEIKSGGQEMAAMMLMLINFNNGFVHC